MTTQIELREGDIIRVVPTGLVEHSVMEVHSTTLRVRDRDGHVRIFDCDRVSELVRRPVRVGDRLRLAKGTYPEELNWSNTVREITPSGNLWFDPVEGARTQHAAAWWKSYVHMSGIPIEPPETAAPRTYRANYLGSESCTKPHAPTTESMARALFETDPRVLEFVDKVADHWGPRENSGDVTFRVSHQSRIDRAIQIAWDRDEHGWRQEARERANKIIFDKLYPLHGKKQ